MREMKDSGIEWIGIIPSDWKISRIKYVATFINGDRGANYPSGSDLVDEGIIFLTSNNIHGTMLDCRSEISKYITTDRYSILGGAKIALGDIIYCLRGSVGNCAINKEATEGTVASSLVDIRPTKIHPEYLNYILQSPINSVQTLAYMNGSCAANLSAENVANYYFIEPPVTKQRIISAFLDSKCSEIDSIISDIQSQIETLEEYKRSVITEAVTKGLDPDVEMRESGIEWLGFIPVSWQTRKGKYVFVQRNERGNSIELQLLSPTQKYGVIPQDLYEEISGYKAVKLDEKTDYSLLKTIHKGDYCISLRSFQGGFEYSEYEGVVSPAYQVFYPVIEVFRGYYKHLFKTQIFIDKMNAFTMSLRDGKNIAFADFGNTYIPIPPIQEQQQIADYLDSKCAEIDSIISEKKQQIATIEEYKKSLIFEYVTGKKKVTTQAIVIDPRVILAGIVLSKLGANLKGKIQVQKIMFLCETMLGLPFQTQYFRYPHGPYDKNINTYFMELNSNQWFIIQNGSPMTYSNGNNFSDFENKYLTPFSKYTAEIERIIKFIAPMKTSQAERIATLFAVWNDLIIDGVTNPSDEQIINEVITNWTPNKANSAIETWKGSLDKMKKNGIIPKGLGKHTQQKDI